MIFGKNSNKKSVLAEAASHILKMILLEELSQEQIDELVDDKAELDAAVSEEILTESVSEELCEYKGRADKPTLMAAYTRAEEADDEDFKKLVTAMSVVDELQGRIIEKYGQQANSDVEEVAEKAADSASDVVAEAARKYLARRKSR